MTMNQTAVIGPKTKATAAVPRLWTAKRADKNREADRQHVGLSAGVTSFRPSTAESTEIAGVMIASP